VDIFEVFRDRRSIRKYKNMSVEPDKLEQVLEAARLAPSWKNLQCWRFLIIDNSAKKKALFEAFPEGNPGTKALDTAPLVIVVCADPTASGVENGIDYFVADTAIAFEHLCLAAHALGLGTCWLGWFDEAAVKKSLNIPASLRVIGWTPLGYPDQEAKARPRKTLAEITCYNQWENNHNDQR